PKWIVDARDYLYSVSEEEWWRELVSVWLQFEEALGYADGQNQANWLAPKGRPEEVAYWIRRGRKYEKPPKVNSIPTFVNAFRKWWMRLQPSTRRAPESAWPMPRVAPPSLDAWSDVRRGGSNGLFMVVMCLAWWTTALGGDADTADIKEAVGDVVWACEQMAPTLAAHTPPLAPTPTPLSPSPSSSQTAVPIPTVDLSTAPEVSSIPAQSAPASAGVSASSVAVTEAAGGDDEWMLINTPEDVAPETSSARSNLKRASPAPEHGAPAAKKTKDAAAA
ncbi:hypothetical protein K466DRAFT_504480, partial [Polyporus arcularius HHB13444]